MHEIKDILTNIAPEPKKEVRLKKAYLESIWAEVGQVIGYNDFEIDPIAQNYINFFSSKREDYFPELINNPSKGILSMGHVGTGKTANFKIYQTIYEKIAPKTENRQLPTLAVKNGTRFVMLHVNEIQRSFKINGEVVIDELSKHKSLVIDDLGVESQDFKDFGTSRNIIIDILNLRYNKMRSHGLITHFTTNLDAAEIKKFYGDRNYDRIKEMSIQITADGQSKRK